jgi:hypothetical protein
MQQIRRQCRSGLMCALQQYESAALFLPFAQSAALDDPLFAVEYAPRLRELPSRINRQ